MRWIDEEAGKRIIDIDVLHIMSLAIRRRLGLAKRGYDTPRY